MCNKTCHLCSYISLATSWFPCGLYFIFPILNSSVLGSFLTTYSPNSLGKFYLPCLDVDTIFSPPLFSEVQTHISTYQLHSSIEMLHISQVQQPEQVFPFSLQTASPFKTSTIINGTTIQAISLNLKLGIITYSSLIFILQSPTSISFTTISYTFI